MGASQRNADKKYVTGGVSSKASNKRIWAILSIIFAGVVLIGVALFFIVGGVMRGDKAEFEQYLENKYNQKFTVENIQSSAVGLGMPGQRIGAAYPVDDPSLRFKVGKDRNANSYFDDYVGILWAKQEEPMVQSFLSSIYPDSQVPQFDLILRQESSTPTEDIVSGSSIPTIGDALASLNSNFFYSLHIKATSDHDLSPAELEEHTNKLRQIIDFILSKGVSHPHVRYAINLENENASYLCSLSQDDLTKAAQVTNCLTKKNGKAW